MTPSYEWQEPKMPSFSEANLASSQNAYCICTGIHVQSTNTYSISAHMTKWNASCRMIRIITALSQTECSFLAMMIIAIAWFQVRLWAMITGQVSRFSFEGGSKRWNNCYNRASSGSLIWIWKLLYSYESTHLLTPVHPYPQASYDSLIPLTAQMDLILYFRSPDWLEMKL